MFFLCFELTGGLWLGEDLYSTVSQSDQTPRRVTRDRGEERRGDGGGWRGPCPGRLGGCISDDIIMTGFGRFASLLVSSTGASNRTFTTQLSDRRERTNSVWGGGVRVSHAGKNSHNTEQQSQKQSDETCCERVWKCHERWADERKSETEVGQEETQEWWDVKHRTLKANGQVRGGRMIHAAVPPLLGGTYSARLYSLTYSDLLVCRRGSSHIPLLTHLMWNSGVNKVKSDRPEYTQTHSQFRTSAGTLQ